MEIITMNHPDIKKRRLASKSRMKIRITTTSIKISEMTCQTFGLKKFDRIVVVKEEKEMWMRKDATGKEEGFMLMGANKKGLTINDSSLCSYLSDFYKKKSPFDLKVIVSNDSMYLKAE